MATPRHVAFDIEFRRPSDLVSLWPVVFMALPVLMGGVSYWLIPAARHGAFAVVWVFFFVIGLATLVHSYKNTTGTIRVLVKEEDVVLTEQPGRGREISIESIKQVVPSRHTDDYGDETQLGWVSIITKEDKIFRVPENRVFLLPYEHAVNLARNLLRALKGQELLEEEAPPA